MDINKFEEILNDYVVYYKITEGKAGTINYRLKRITINPCFNEEEITLCHELFHHYYDNILFQKRSEEFIEHCAKEFFMENRKEVEGLVKKVLHK